MTFALRRTTLFLSSPKTMAQFFISYAREDVRYAQKLARLLEETGHTVWWDRHMKAGDDINVVIDAELAKASAVIVLWSKESVQSNWVRGEAQTALDDGKLIPANIEECRLPINFRHFHTPELFQSDQEFHSLAALLSEKVTGAPSTNATAAGTPHQELQTPEVQFSESSVHNFRSEMTQLVTDPASSFSGQVSRDVQLMKKYPFKTALAFLGVLSLSLLAFVIDEYYETGKLLSIILITVSFTLYVVLMLYLRARWRKNKS